jgi:hypothetical protein
MRVCQRNDRGSSSALCKRSSCSRTAAECASCQNEALWGCTPTWVWGCRPVSSSCASLGLGVWAHAYAVGSTWAQRHSHVAANSGGLPFASVGTQAQAVYARRLYALLSVPACMCLPSRRAASASCDQQTALRSLERTRRKSRSGSREVGRFEMSRCSDGRRTL